jgi:hypothetical protein|nr:MAG TPA: hypothetical protein [Bacteriophage sp.]
MSPNINECPFPDITVVSLLFFPSICNASLIHPQLKFPGSEVLPLASNNVNVLFMLLKVLPVYYLT